MNKVNIAEKLGLFSEHWSLKVVGELNGQQVKFAKLLGTFDWHHHEQEDEFFLLLKGRLTLRLRDRSIALEAGEFFIVPARRRTPARGRGGGARVLRPDSS